MKNVSGFFITLALCLFMSHAVLAQNKSAAAVNIISATDLQAKKIGNFSVKSAQLSQLKQGVNAIKFSPTQTLEVSYVGSKTSQMYLVSGTGVRTALAQTTKLGFVCSGGGCACWGDKDCNDMISSGVCSTKGIVVNGACVGSVCVCQMKQN